MFDTLSDRLGGIFDSLTRRGVLKEQDVDEVNAIPISSRCTSTPN